jgi:putative hydrolase of the HAD superfamily
LIKAVVFDWFNTLARYEPPREEIHSRALHKFGVEIEPVKLIAPLLVADKYFYDENTIRPIRSRSPEEQFALYTRYEEIILSEAGIKFNKDFPAKVFKEGDDIFGRKSEFVLFDDVLPTLKKLHERNLPLGLLTNLTKDVDVLSRKLGLEPYLNFIITPAIAGADKPNPAIFRAAVARTGLSAEECLYVGDQYKIDIVGARNAGMQAVLIDRYNISPDLKECSRIISLSEIVKFL